MAGTGTILHGMAKSYAGEDVMKGCKCAKWIKLMDDNGPAWCRQHVDEIVGVMVNEAKRRAGNWKLVRCDEDGNPLPDRRTMRLKRIVWRGAMLVPGAGMLLPVFIRQMVERAITKAEEEINAVNASS